MQGTLLWTRVFKGVKGGHVPPVVINESIMEKTQMAGFAFMAST
jgi:hypothetical protein